MSFRASVRQLTCYLHTVSIHLPLADLRRDHAVTVASAQLILASSFRKGYFSRNYLSLGLIALSVLVITMSMQCMLGEHFLFKSSQIRVKFERHAAVDAIRLLVKRIAPLLLKRNPSEVMLSSDTSLACRNSGS